MIKTYYNFCSTLIGLFFMPVLLSSDTFIPIIQDDIMVIIKKQTTIGTIAYRGKPYGLLLSPYTGRVWLDRNIGASRVCKRIDDSLCFGGYFQWGRNADGHENPNSLVTNTLATDITNADDRFIVSDVSNNWDWSAVDSSGVLRSANWSKTDGSSVCPIGFRVPTIDEIKNELVNPGSAEIQNAQDAFDCFLKLPLSGFRSGYSAAIFNIGETATFFSTSPTWTLEFSPYNVYIEPSGDGGHGYTGFVRCIRDE